MRKEAASIKFSLFLPCATEVIETIVKDIIQFYRTPGRENVKGTVHIYGSECQSTWLDLGVRLLS